jgi:diketogulonate reductase-like aldo/keto reductase
MTRSITLSDGTKIPSLAWGNMGGKEKALSAGAAALKAGILHIDSAQIYGTEAEVPGAIKAAGLKREDVYVTTKRECGLGAGVLHTSPHMRFNNCSVDTLAYR